MNKKTIIQLVIIVVAFGAAGLVLYNGLFKSGGGTISPLAEVENSSASSTSQAILPYGGTLDFSKVLDPNRFQYNEIDYQQLDPQSDVGVPVDNLITPNAVTTAGQTP
jgi:hypothetical protein